MNEQPWATYEINDGTSIGEIIRIVGVGGGGGNAVNYIYKKGIRSVSCIAINTDIKALNGIDVPKRIPISNKGLGSGTNPEVAKTYAESHEEDIKEALEGAEMIFITAGMGKGTGTGASPVVARIARDMGILTVGVVTLPFKFEGNKPLEKAFGGLEELRKNVDCVLIIANEQIRKIHKDLPFSQAFHMADDTIADAIRGISGAVTESSGIRTDMEDMRTILKDSRNIMMGVGIGTGENRAIDAIHEALTSPLLVNNCIKGAKQAIVNYAFHPDHEITLEEINDINLVLEARVGTQWEQQIWGTTIDEDLGENLKVTVVIAGVEDLTIENFKEIYKEEEKKNIITTSPILQQIKTIPDSRTEENPIKKDDDGPTSVEIIQTVRKQDTSIDINKPVTDSDIDAILLGFDTNSNVRSIEMNQLARNRTESSIIVSNEENPIRFNGFLNNNVD